MKRIIRAINYYFLPEENEEIHWSDYIWFYGIFGFMGIVLIFLLIINMVNYWG